MNDASLPPAATSLPAAGTRTGPVAAWMQASRVKSLAISSIGVLVGATVALAHGEAVGAWPLRLLLALVGSIAIQAGTNLTNVGYNYKARSRAASVFVADPRRSSAPVIEGRLTAEQVLRGAYLCFAVGVACGLALVALCGLPILWIGIPAVLAGYSYAGPPIRLSRLGLGVPTVFVFMGPIMVAGAYHVIALRDAAPALLAALPIGLLAAGIMHTNDLRDYAGDLEHGKRTFTTILGRQNAEAVQIGMIGGAFVAVVGAVAAGLLPWPVLVVLLTVPRAVQHLRLVIREDVPARVHDGWLRGVQLHTEFGLLLIVGLLVATALR